MSEQETEIATDSTTEAESTVDAVESRPDAVLPVGDTDVTDGEVRSEADVPVVDAVDASALLPVGDAVVTEPDTDDHADAGVPDADLDASGADVETTDDGADGHTAETVADDVASKS